MINPQRLTKEFLEFVRLPSPSLRERKFADRVKRSLAHLGLRCREDRAGKAIGGDCGNLLVRLPGDRSKPTLLLCAHLDTVERGERIAPRVKHGVILSSGRTILGADDKAAVAAILEALRLLREKKIPHPPLEIVFTVAEELGLLGVQHFAHKRLKAKAGFILDSAGPVGGIISRAPSCDVIKATIIGRAAHAGAFPEEGVSAIRIAGRAIAKMRLGRVDKETTANIGLISGGTAQNVVPERCFLQGEARSHREASLRRQVQQMLRGLHDSAAALGGKMEVEIVRQFQAFHAPMNSPPVRIARRAARRLHLPFASRATGGGADTSVFAASGIPCVTVNIGCENPHSVNESISIEQLRLLAEFTLALILEAA